MELTVKLFATLREGRGKILNLNVEDGSTIRTVTDGLNIPEKEIAILLRNGRDAHLENLVHEGDVLSIFPPVGGG